MTTATVQHQARALGNETRYRIYQFLAEADEPVDVTGLVDEFGLTYNAMRRPATALRRRSLSGKPGASDSERWEQPLWRSSWSCSSAAGRSYTYPAWIPSLGL
ncbi:MAG: ArsR family transcriptional regulator [Actinobacteria bacterium ATB1]|nr:ArsR family transcriptional regulator [Actinobacteria bacterium ATB1]